MKFETAAIDPELIGQGLRVRDAAHVVRSESGGNNRFVREHDARDRFKIQIALRFFEKDWTSPPILARFYFFEIPVGAFNQSDSESSSARASPVEQIAQIVFGISQISLNDNSNLRPVAKFTFGKERFEKLERRVFVRVTFHVEIHERAEFLRASKNWAQFRPEMRDCVGRIGRIHLRIKRGNFYGKINDRKQLGIFAKRIGPAACFAPKMLE